MDIKVGEKKRKLWFPSWISGIRKNNSEIKREGQRKLTNKRVQGWKYYHDKICGISIVGLSDRDLTKRESKMAAQSFQRQLDNAKRLVGG